MSSLVNAVHIFFVAISPFAKLTAGVAVAAFGLAVWYAFRPTDQKLVLMRPISLAAIFAAISGTIEGWIYLLGGIAATPDGQLPNATFYRGLGASLALCFVCFGLLAAAWLFVAVGVLRRGSAELA